MEGILGSAPQNPLTSGGVVFGYPRRRDWVPTIILAQEEPGNGLAWLQAGRKQRGQLIGCQRSSLLAPAGRAAASVRGCETPLDCTRK